MIKTALVRQSSTPLNAVVSTVYDGLPNTNAVISVMIDTESNRRKRHRETVPNFMQMRFN